MGTSFQAGHAASASLSRGKGRSDKKSKIEIGKITKLQNAKVERSTIAGYKRLNCHACSNAVEVSVYNFSKRKTAGPVLLHSHLCQQASFICDRGIYCYPLHPLVATT